MKPAVYHWRNMLYDYAHLAFGDTWYWCSRCGRPVEHVVVQRDGDGGDDLACLDCGAATSDILRTIPRPPATGF